MRHFIFALSLIIFNSLNGQSIQSLYENLEKQKDYKNWRQANTIIDSLLGIDQNNNYWLIEKVKISLELGYTNTALNNMQAAIKNGYRNLEVLQRLKAYPNLKDNSSYHSIIQDLETDLLKFKVPSNNPRINNRYSAAHGMLCYYALSGKPKSHTN